jgi:FkbM family methyltransferase
LKGIKATIVNCRFFKQSVMQNNSFGKNLIRGFRKRIDKITHNPYRKINLNRWKLVYYKHLPPGKLLSHNLFGKKIYFFSATEFLYGMREIFIDEIYKQKLIDHPYIIDCGANIGLSVIYMKMLYPDAEIIAFEPDDKNFELLKKNIDSFGFKKTTALKEAVWIEDTVLHFAGEGSMSSKIEHTASGNSVQVKAIRLRDFLNRDVDFLKIDIEGAEVAVINDIADHLHFVKNLFLEYHGSFEQNKELCQLLSLIVEKGFSYYIKEAISAYDRPFELSKNPKIPYDVQLNIFCFRKSTV